MWHYPQFNPVAFSLGAFSVRWYALCYILAFLAGYLYVKRLFIYRGINMTREVYDNFIFYIMLGVIVGGRFGYVLFYNLSYYIAHPLEIILPFSFDGGIHYVGIAGLSFHGGALGVILFGWLFCRRNELPFLSVADTAMPSVALGLGFGRMGNFINGELYGRVTSSPLGMVFPDGGPLPRHPSQLYEACLEGLAMYLVLYAVLKRTRKSGLVFWLFIALYGIFRFIIEFLRQPDAQLGFVLGPFSMGQVLCFLMIIAAGIGFWSIYRKPAIQ